MTQGLHINPLHGIANIHANTAQHSSCYCLFLSGCGKFAARINWILQAEEAEQLQLLENMDRIWFQVSRKAPDVSLVPSSICLYSAMPCLFAGSAAVDGQTLASHGHGRQILRPPSGSLGATATRCRWAGHQLLLPVMVDTLTACCICWRELIYSYEQLCTALVTCLLPVYGHFHVC